MKSLIIVLGCMVALSAAQRRPPNYSQDEMPDTSFDCRDKVVGGYYADQETDCQMFHVCVKVPGVGVQDYRFLCPNDTTFDQENQICANWYDIDCEASTLYYSDNFDLYRIDKGQAVVRTPTPLGPSTQRAPAALPKKRPVAEREEDEEEEFYLQRSETGDRRLQKDLLRGSSSGNFFNKNRGKDDDDAEDYVKTADKKAVEPQRSNGRRGSATDPKKKVAVRKLRKRPQNDGVDVNSQQSYDANPTTYAPPTTHQQTQQTQTQQTQQTQQQNNDRYVNRQNNRFRTTQVEQKTTTQNFEPQKSSATSTTISQSPSTAAPPSFNERTARTQYQPRYNTVNRNNNNNAPTTTTTTLQPVQAAVNSPAPNVPLRNSRLRYNPNPQRNFVSKSTTTQFVEYTTTPKAPTTRNQFSQSVASTFDDTQPRGFEVQKVSPKSSVATSTTVNYQQNDGFKSNNANFNNQNSGSFKAVGDFSRSTTVAPTTYNGFNNNANFNNQNSGSFKAVGDFSRSTTVAPTTYNGFNNNANFNNQNSGSFKAVGDFSRSSSIAYSTTVAPVTYNGNYKFNKAQNFESKPTTTAASAKPDYQDYNGSFDSYGNQRNQQGGESDEYVENARVGEEEFLKTAPSNNIRPSNFNSFQKSYSTGAPASPSSNAPANPKSTTNFNYDAKLSTDFVKLPKQKNNNNNNNNNYFSTPSQYENTNPTTRRPSTQFFQSTPSRFYQSPAVETFPPTTYSPPRSSAAFTAQKNTPVVSTNNNFYQPSSSSYKPVGSTTTAPQVYQAPSKTTDAAKKAVEEKLTGKKVKDASYDYAYYDDTEYEGADPISDHHFGVAGESQRIKN